MTSISQSLLAVSPAVAAALLLVARTLCAASALPTPTVGQILAATHASRSSAYEILDSLVAQLVTLQPSRGRPPKPKPPVGATTDGAAVTLAVLDYVMRNPGSAHRSAIRQHYSDGFRRFVVDLYARYESLEVEAFAAAANVPLGTFKDWIKTHATPATPPVEGEHRDDSTSQPPSADCARMQTVLDAFSRWKGSFLPFCEHVRVELRIPFGRDLVARILDVNGVRKRSHRDGRRPDEIAMRGAFLTYFPGAQWVGDGMQVPVVVDGQRFNFNLELNVDAHSGAFVGVSVRREEDSAAVVEAFHDGVLTTDAQPIALLLDNRPSNLTPEVLAVLGDTLLIRATPGRGQNKGHVEGAFGLFSQILPNLSLDTRLGPVAVAGAFLGIVAQVWARTTNHRPRAGRDGRSRAELYGDKPSDAQIAHARAELRETAQRQELARQTLEARRRPDVLLLLDSHFKRLQLLDPQRHICVAIAGYSLNAIVDGIAIFEGKRTAKTLPPGVDARYLLGIVRNIHASAEGEQIARRLFQLRVEARDAMLASLVAAAAVVCARKSFVADCVDRALETESQLVRTFWLDALADVIRTRVPSTHQALFHAAARRIEATYAIAPLARHDAVRLLADRIVILA